MASTYKAAVWTGDKKVEVVEKPIPIPGQGQVLLKVKAAGICGTDLHILAGKHPEAKPPLVPGHEFAGIVADIGPDIDKSLIGRRVGSDSYIGCGKCIYCLTRQTQLCEKGTVELGVNLDGGWAEYVLVPKDNIYFLPDNVEFFISGAGCILNCPPAAIEKVNILPGDTVLIIGDGPSSLIMIQLAKLKGASKVIISGHRQIRLSLAVELGADIAVNTHQEDLFEVMNSLGRQPEVIIDAVGKSETLAAAIKIAGRMSRIHLFGLPEEPLNNLPMDLLLFKEVTLVSSTGYPKLWSTMMDYISRGLIKVSSIISHRFPIEEAPKAIDYIYGNPEKVIKAVFEMNGG